MKHATKKVPGEPRKFRLVDDVFHGRQQVESPPRDFIGGHGPTPREAEAEYRFRRELLKIHPDLPEPAERKFELKEFPLHHDSKLDRTGLEGRFAHRVSMVAHLIANGRLGCAFWTRDWTVVGANPKALAWGLLVHLVQQAVPETYRVRASRMLGRLAPALMDMDDRWLVLEE